MEKDKSIKGNEYFVVMNEHKVVQNAACNSNGKNDRFVVILRAQRVQRKYMC